MKLSGQDTFDEISVSDTHQGSRRQSLDDTKWNVFKVSFFDQQQWVVTKFVKIEVPETWSLDKIAEKVFQILKSTGRIHLELPTLDKYVRSKNKFPYTIRELQIKKVRML